MKDLITKCISLLSMVLRGVGMLMMSPLAVETKRLKVKGSALPVIIQVCLYLLFLMTGFQLAVGLLGVDLPVEQVMKLIKAFLK
jgi:hypothetical protein